MTTIEHPRVDTQGTGVARPGASRGRQYAILVVVALLALVLGGIGGWMLRGSDAPGDIIVAGEGDLTERQADMLDVMRDAELAWQSNDADGVLALYAPNGTFEAFDTVYRVDDGTFADYVEMGSWSSLEVHEPVLVRGNEILTFHTFGGQTYTESMTFTSTGDLLITSHVIHS